MSYRRLIGFMVVAVFITLCTAIVLPLFTGPKSYRVSVGIIESGPRRFLVRGPANAWFSGISITLENGLPKPTNKISLTIRQDGQVIVKKDFSGADLLESNWHKRGGYVLQLRSDVRRENHQKLLGYGSKFEITAQAEYMEDLTVTMWSHLVDDRLIKWP